MTSSPTSSAPEFSLPLLSALEQCSEESVTSPGHIQPYGILLLLEEPHLTVVQVSQTAEDVWGIPADALVGQPLHHLFPRAQVKRIANCLQQSSPEQCNPLELSTRGNNHPTQIRATADQTPTKTQTFRGSLYRVDAGLILELEPQVTTQKAHSTQFYHHLQRATLNLRRATSLIDLAQTLARAVREMTGFDRVMVYRFEADEHGMVIAEEKASHMESYLGLHYPATDIPVPARQLFLQNWVRQIPDVNYTPVPLISGCESQDASPLNLSHCVLRGASPYHLEYLRNMGVAGTLTISLISDQRLWGLISCHHASPKYIDGDIRKTCEFLGQLASIELVHQQERELDAYRTQVKTIQDQLQQELLRRPDFIQQVLAHSGSDLLNLVHAEGVAIALDQHITLLGQTPSLQQVQALLTGLSQLNSSDLYVTNCLVRSYPAARAFTHVASGILAISIVLHQKSYHLLWFRPEQIQTVHWAGNPQDSIAIDDAGLLHLCPRTSFALWRETVQDTCSPWQSAEMEAARMMRNTLMLAVLEFSQAALEEAAERAAIANQAKSQFLAKMSHELRTPLNAILGFTQLMNRNPNTPTEFQDYLGIISRSGEHLLTLINDVLEMSRIEAGQVVISDIHFNLHRLLQSLQDMFALKATEKGLMLCFENTPDLPRYVLGDEAKLRQILINLIGNAVKFTAQGKVTVQTRSEIIQARKPRNLSNTTAPCYALKLTFAITDTGCGLDRQDWESVFDAFIQTKQGRQAQEGTGLGLSISRQFARLMGGDITVTSVVGQGATFSCTVVVHQPDLMDLVEPEGEHSVVGLEPGQPSYRILIVEDVLENRQLLKALLEPVGFELLTAETGEEAIAHWQTWLPHLILMDIQMPGMDGYETTRQIRLLEQTTPSPVPGASVPIIALTACAFEADRVASLKAGCDDYISKPFSEAALFEAIAQQLDVQYRYAQSGSAKTVRPDRPPLSAQDFRVMPGEWVMQIHEAALELNDTRLRHLMTQIPPHQQSLVDGMKRLVDNFQLDAIAALTGVQEEHGW